MDGRGSWDERLVKLVKLLMVVNGRSMVTLMVDNGMRTWLVKAIDCDGY